MSTNKYNTKNIESGDTLVDPIDGEHRTVSHVWNDTIYLYDGGVMGMDEDFEIRLPGEETEQ